MTTPDFSSFNLDARLEQALTELGYTEPTPIQAAAIPAMLAGQDIIGQAQTGTGKTAAFALPILHNLPPGRKGVQCLVLAPTRELAIQVAEAFQEYGRHLGVRVLAVYGGQAYGRQIGPLKRGVDVVVGTPGRLLDLIKQQALDLSGVSSVVLDEADEMLSMGFIEDIETILEQTPATRQTALFSATLPQPIRRLADRYMHNPQAIIIQRQQMTVAAIEQRYYLINEADRTAALTRLFEVEPITSALIFVRTRLASGELAAELTARGFPAEALNGDMGQDARIRILNRFRESQITVLVATDVAARGLDIDDISHVINYELPQDLESYVHRIGRTGRAGRSGVAMTLLTPREQWRLHKIEAYTKQKVKRATLPTIEDIERHREAELMTQMDIWLRRGRCRREQALVTELIEAGHEPLMVAAVALKLARAEEKQRPIAPISEVQKRPSRKERRRGGKPQGRRAGRQNGQNDTSTGKQSHEEGMIRLTLDVGKADGVRVSHIVGTLAYHAKIPGHTLGKIVIQKQETFVDVPEPLVGRVLAKTGSYRLGQQRVNVERA